MQFEHDCHVHSSRSDGLERREAVIQRLKDSGIKSFVFTEHNNIVDFSQAKKQAENQGVSSEPPGLEMTVLEPESRLRVHLLGYGERLLSPEFISWVTEGIRKREIFYRGVIQQAEEKLGIILPPFEDIVSAKPIEGVDLPYPYDPNRYMVSAKIIAIHISRLTGLDPQLSLDKYVPKFSVGIDHKMSEAIRMVKEIGGVVVLAHPCWLKGGNFDDQQEILKRAIELGIDGLEARHPKQSPQESLELYEMAITNDLLVLGGSDYHGRPEEKVFLGCFGVTPDEKNMLLDKIVKRQ